jgi:NTE family protein
MSKIGLCLTGGGARGAFQIGVIQALFEYGIYDQVHAMSGTSIGAANVSALASTSISEVKDIWFNLPDEALKQPKPIIERLKKERLRAFENGLFSMDNFKDVMMTKINVEKLKNQKVYVTMSEIGEKEQGLLNIFRASYRHFIKNDTKIHYLPLHKLDQETALEVVTASCSIPVVFPPIIQEDKKYYDGGLYDNTPVKPLIDEGCDEIFVIDIAFFRQPGSLEKKYPEVLFHIIRPQKRIGSILDFSVEHSKKIYEQGYQDAIAFLDENQ